MIGNDNFISPNAKTRFKQKQIDDLSPFCRYIIKGTKGTIHSTVKCQTIVNRNISYRTNIQIWQTSRIRVAATDKTHDKLSHIHLKCLCTACEISSNRKLMVDSTVSWMYSTLYKRLKASLMKSSLNSKSKSGWH